VIRPSIGASAFIAALALQPQQAGQRPVFRAEVDLYTVHVSVTDESGAPVEDLGVEDIEVIEDGERQQVVSVLTAHEAPLDVAVVLDVSGSMATTMPSAPHDLHRFLDGLSDRDCVLFVSFRDRVVRALWGPPQHSDLRATIDLEIAEGGTAVYDGAVAALAELADMKSSALARELANAWSLVGPNQKARGVGGCPSPEAAGFGTTERRRALLLISDGADNRSQHGGADVVDLASLAGVPILALAAAPNTALPDLPNVPARLLGPRSPPTDVATMRSLADRTGGRLLIGPSGFGDALSWLRGTYLVGYRPPTSATHTYGVADFSTHTVEVRILRDDTRAVAQIEHYRPTFDPNAGRAALEQAKALLESGGDASRALASLDSAIAQDPQRSEAHFQRAIALAILGRTGEALESARQATYLDSGVGAAHYLIGVLAEQLGDLDTAWRELVNAELAGHDVSSLRARLEHLSEPPEFVAPRRSAPRLLVRLAAGLPDLEQIRLYRRATRALRRLLAERSTTGVVVRPERGDYFLVVVPDRYEPGPPRAMSVTLALYEVDGDRRQDVEVAIADVDDVDAMDGELSAGLQAIVDWLDSHWESRQGPDRTPGDSASTGTSSWMGTWRRP
jgi:VWFA-related protein